MTNTALGVGIGKARGGGAQGGAIYNQGQLLLREALFAGNRADGGYGGGSSGVESQGGALYTATSAVVVDNTAKAGRGGNAAGISAPGGHGSGGAIYSAGMLWMTNSTVASNRATGGNSEAGVFVPVTGGNGNGGGIWATGTLTSLTHVTLARNSASAGRGQSFNGTNVAPDGASSGGGIFSASGSLLALNTIIANSPSGSNCFGLITDGGGNTSSTLTDANGNYAFNGLKAGIYAVLPFSPSLIFVPDLRVVTVGPDAVGIDFTGYRVNYLSLEPSSNAVQHYVFAGTNGHVHEIQVSTNLVNWLTIATNTVDPRGIFEYFFTNNAFADRMRFLRTRKQP